MNPSWASVLGQRWQQLVGSGDTHGAAERGILSLPDIQFSDEGPEKELATLWQSYHDSLEKGGHGASKRFEEFLALFVRVYEDWIPGDLDHVTEPAAEGDEIPGSREAAGGKFSNAARNTVIGCEGGHPTEVISAFVDELKKAIKRFDKDAEDNEESMDFQEGLGVLHALVIATRSEHNRRVFSFFDGFDALMRLMKGAVVRLKIVANIVTSDRRASLSNFTQLSLLQCLQAHIVSITANLLEGEAREARQRGGSRTGAPSGPHAAESSQNSRGSQDAAPSSILLLEKGGINHVVELLRLLRLLAEKGTITDASLEHLTMRTLHSALLANPKLQQHLPGAGAIDVLVEGIGWPPPHMAGVPGEPLDQSIYDEFSRQLLALRVLREAVYMNVSNLQHLADSEGFAKFAGLLRWVAWTFSESGGKAQQASELAYSTSRTVLKPFKASATAKPSRMKSDGPENGEDGDEGDSEAKAILECNGQQEVVLSQPILGSAEDELHNWNQQAADVCSVLCSLLAVPESELSSKGRLAIVGPQSSSSGQSSYWELATQWVIWVFLETFRDNAEPLDHAKEVTLFFRCSSSTLQSYVLYIFRKVLGTSPSTLRLFRDGGVWATLFSPAFFYFGMPPESATREPMDGGRTPRPGQGMETPRRDGSGTPRRSQFDGPRQHGHASFDVPETPSMASNRAGRSTEASGGYMRARSKSPIGKAAALAGGDSKFPPRPDHGKPAGRRGFQDVPRGADAGPAGSGLAQTPRRAPSTKGFSGVGGIEGLDETVHLTELPETLDAESLRLEVITFVEAAATQDEVEENKAEIQVLLEALHRCAVVPSVAAVLVRCVHRILQLISEPTATALYELKSALLFAQVMELQQQAHSETRNRYGGAGASMAVPPRISGSLFKPVGQVWWLARTALFSLFEDFLMASEAARSSAATNWKVMSALFDHLEEAQARRFALRAILTLLKAPAKSTWSNMGLFTRYIETIKAIRERRTGDVAVLSDLLAGIREVLTADLKYYQALFVEGGCFEELVALLSEDYASHSACQLCLDVVLTIIKLLEDDKPIKAAFRALPSVGPGYEMLVQPLLECYQQQPDKALLKALLDLLVDGDFDPNTRTIIENEDAITLFINIVRKCEMSVQLEYLLVFERLLAESTANCASCVRAGLMSLLLDWLAEEDEPELQVTVSMLIQMVGSHSMTGKDLRTVISLLRSTKDGRRPRHGCQLLRTLQAMVKEDGPTVFFELNGKNSGIEVTTPMRLPSSRGFTFCCWFRVEGYPASNPDHGPYARAMGLVSLLTDSAKGYTAYLQDHRIVIYLAGAKEQIISVPWLFNSKKWFHVAVTHNVGQLLAGHSQLKVYVDGKIVASVKAVYPKLVDPLTHCTFVSAARLPTVQDSSGELAGKGSCAPFRGQLGPIYLFDDAITALQVEGIFALGPSYMYSFSSSEFGQLPEVVSSHGLTDAKEGLASRILASYNAQASGGSIIFDTSPLLDHSNEQTAYDSQILSGVQLCYRQRVQDVIHCVGGIGVLFPLFTQLDQPIQPTTKQLTGGSKARTDGEEAREEVDAQFALDIIGLLTAVLAGNHTSQQYMLNISGFACLGFLLQRVAPYHLGVEFVLALENLVGCISHAQDRALADALVKEAMARLYLNPMIWIYTPYAVQWELYSSLLRQVDKDYERMRSLCSLAPMLDIIRQYYWEKPQGAVVYGAKPLVHPQTNKTIGVRPQPAEIAKLRLLVLGVAERMLREGFLLAEVKALVAFLESSKDTPVMENVLQTVLGLLGRKVRVNSLVQHVYALGGCQIFLGLLSRDHEPIRLLGLRLIGSVLVATPHEKRAGKEPPSGNPLSASERSWVERVALAPFFGAIEESISVFPVTDSVWLTVFDLLMGTCMPREAVRHWQALRKGLLGKKDASRSKLASLEDGYFLLPQVLRILFTMLLASKPETRGEVLATIVRLVEGTSSNKEVVAKEPSWQQWVFDLLAVIRTAGSGSAEGEEGGEEAAAALAVEEALVYKLVMLVHVHCICNIKAGWRPVERTVDFLHTIADRGVLPALAVTRNILADVLENVLKECPNQAALMTHPCRDNCLYVLSLIEEVTAIDCAKYTHEQSESAGVEAKGGAGQGDSGSGGSWSLSSEDAPAARAEEGLLRDDLSPAITTTRSREPRGWQHKTPSPVEDTSESRRSRWRLYGAFWAFLRALNGVGEHREPWHSSAGGAASSEGSLSRQSSLTPPPTPTFTQRARGLVESLTPQNVEVIGGLGGGSAVTRGMEKAVKLRGEKCPRMVFRLMLLYVYEAELEVAAEQVKQFLSLLPSLLAVENDATKNRLHLFLWNLKTARFKLPFLDRGERIPMVSQLIHGTIEHAKGLLASSLAERKAREADSSGSALDRVIQQDRVLAAMKAASQQLEQARQQRAQEVEQLRGELNSAAALETQQKRVLKEKRQATMVDLCTVENVRRASDRLHFEAEQQAIARQWLQLYRDLTSERGPWSSGVSPEDPPLRWKLDKMEDAFRRRPRLRPNYRFDTKLLLPPEDDRAQRNAGTEGEEEDGRDGSSVPFVIKGLKTANSFSGLAEMPEEGEEGEQASEASSQAELMDPEAIQQALAEHAPSPHQQAWAGAGAYKEAVEDKVMVTAACVLVTAKRKVAGRIEVKRAQMNFHGEYVVEGTGGSSLFDVMGNLQPPGEVTGPMVEFSKGDEKAKKGSLRVEVTAPSLGGKQEAATKMLSAATLLPTQAVVQKDPDLQQDVKLYRSWTISQVKEVHITRYLLQFSALEIFFVGSHPPVFVNFSSAKTAKEVAAKLGRLANSAAKALDKDREVLVVDKRKALEMADRAKIQWRNRIISNFEYLMTLNTLAGRSYNDIMQYPVFPWVIADYTSEALDLNDPATFRDLSKPVGALDEKRFQGFQERYYNFNDPEIPSFFYGSHYSTAGIVLFYLIRTEPFSSLNRTLQGGKFDHADRLFHSVESTWANCLTNTSDVKELIPEFYYLPEFLGNSNEYHLGKKQDGHVLGDVILPAWAEGSREEFVRKSREALESEYVSEHLCEWIDLIFGYKQRGPEAVEAGNVFFYLTYEGAVDLDSIEISKRRPLEDQIANFGQTPLQLFWKKHPKRNPPTPISRPLYYAPASITITSTLGPPDTTSPYAALRAGSDPAAVIYVGLAADSKAVALTRGQMMSVRPWITPNGNLGPSFTFSGGMDGYYGFGDYVFSRQIGSPFSGSVEVSPGCFGVLQAAHQGFLLTCGHWDNSFRCVATQDGRTVRTIRQHNDVVTCLAVSTDGSTVVTGSRDTTVMVWSVQLQGAGSGRGLYGGDRQRLEVIPDEPRAVLCGHEDAVVCVAVKAELDLVVSGSKDGTCILHTLAQGRYLRTVRHPSARPVDRLAVSVHGHIVVYSHEDLLMHVCSINGNWLASAESKDRITCMSLNTDNEFLVTGEQKGDITVRWTHSLEVVRKYEGIGVSVTSLAVTREDCFIVGLEDGHLLVYSVEGPQLKRTPSHFYTGR